MNIAYLVVRTDHASVYYRTIQFIPSLAASGAKCTLITIPDRFINRIALFRKLADFDLVVLQRKLFNFMNFAPLRLFSNKLIFDLDDALFIKDSKSETEESITRKIRFNRTARKADFVICGNQWVLDKTRSITPNASIIPTVVDTELYGAPKIHKPKEGFSAVWIGGRSTLFYLEKIIPFLEPLVDEIPGFKLKVISDKFPDSKILPIEKVSWSRKTEIEAVRDADAGLMPLSDDSWSKGKCGLKLLQYGAAGLPMICSPVGVNTQIVLHGKCGFHASDPAEWRDALKTLAENINLRIEMGKQARKLVDDCYSLNALKGEYFSILQKTAQCGIR